MPKVIVDIEFGPITRSLFDILDCCDELQELIPDYYYEEKQELKNRIQTLADVLEQESSSSCQIK